MSQTLSLNYRKGFRAASCNNISKYLIKSRIFLAHISRFHAFYLRVKNKFSKIMDEFIVKKRKKYSKYKYSSLTVNNYLIFCMLMWGDLERRIS